MIKSVKMFCFTPTCSRYNNDMYYFFSCMNSQETKKMSWAL